MNDTSKADRDKELWKLWKQAKNSQIKEIIEHQFYLNFRAYTANVLWKMARADIREFEGIAYLNFLDCLKEWNPDENRFTTFYIWYLRRACNEIWRERNGYFFSKCERERREKRGDDSITKAYFMSKARSLDSPVPGTDEFDGNLLRDIVPDPSPNPDDFNYELLNNFDETLAMHRHWDRNRLEKAAWVYKLRDYYQLNFLPVPPAIREYCDTFKANMRHMDFKTKYRFQELLDTTVVHVPDTTVLYG